MGAGIIWNDEIIIPSADAVVESEYWVIIFTTGEATLED